MGHSVEVAVVENLVPLKQAPLPNMPWMSLKATSALLLTAITLLGSLDSAHSLTAQDVQLNVAAGKALNDSLLWGTYRPNLYFGTKPRIPSSLSTGIMWFSGDDVQGFQSKSHTPTMPSK